ncbi:ribonuclease P protein component [Halalkalibacterium halodurans]|uniref:ribonuclease P protein component n=1 Tax=Halalkalibacterium halodurans TaxID=86665 RepID=UPI002E20C6B5|nr:ribonuclease P protein component [Halalkalibacterium halodurans]MED4084905.1 ribonuclease P protein component [Halalkalibacterium halodurans]MED4103497.1 ribonuclease P protein component [Halalkalibacterium halodurans]MED4107727.1 ribonuclease P protein component [Halalkalibacterium halodurans]MED4123457.1 ribonuclease P protein component [Halalkalibacterium halodurans]
MKKEHRIKRSDEFSRVFNEGFSVANRQFVIYVLPKEGQDFFRVGLSVSKKIGNAVTRNRVKRLIRTFFQEHEQAISGERDYVIIARKPAVDMTYEQVKGSLWHVCKKAKIIQPKVRAHK